MSEAELKSFLDWLVNKQKFHDELSDSEKRSDAFKLNHSSRALAFLEVRRELYDRITAKKQTALEPAAPA